MAEAGFNEERFKKWLIMRHGSRIEQLVARKRAQEPQLHPVKALNAVLHNLYGVKLPKNIGLLAFNTD